MSAVLEAAAATRLYEATSSVVGQEPARRQLAVLLERQIEVAEGKWEISNRGAIMAGNSGTGKTMMARLMCAASALPFAEVNATQYTEAGYMGKQLSDIFLPLIEAAATMLDDREGKAQTDRLPALKREPAEVAEILKLAETGVVFLDEFDKWMQRVNHATGQRGEAALQGELLKLVEGSIEWVGGNEDEDLLGVPFDTSRVLFICAGAFTDVPKLVAKRLHRRTDQDDPKAAVREYLYDPTFWDSIAAEDFIAYGIVPELIGRLSAVIYLMPLRPEHLAVILEAPGGPVEEYRSRFERRGVEWAVDSAALRAIAQESLERATGARGIDHEMWHRFAEALYAAGDAAGRKVVFSVNQHKAVLV